MRKMLQTAQIIIRQILTKMISLVQKLLLIKSPELRPKQKLKQQKMPTKWQENRSSLTLTTKTMLTRWNRKVKTRRKRTSTRKKSMNLRQSYLICKMSFIWQMKSLSKGSWIVSSKRSRLIRLNWSRIWGQRSLLRRRGYFLLPTKRRVCSSLKISNFRKRFRNLRRFCVEQENSEFNLFKLLD